MIKEVYGDVIQADADVIAHQVNCVGVMGAGVAKAIRFSILAHKGYDRYRELCKQHGSNMLGKVYISKTVAANPYKARAIANLFGEDVPTGNGVDTDYDALTKCFTTLRDYCLEHKLSVAIPGYLGCGLAGGDWNHVYSNIIRPLFGDCKVQLLVVYDYNSTLRLLGDFQDLPKSGEAITKDWHGYYEGMSAKEIYLRLKPLFKAIGQ